MKLHESLTAHLMELYSSAPIIDEVRYRLSWESGRDDVTPLFEHAADQLRRPDGVHPWRQLRDIVRQVDMDLIRGKDVRVFLNVILTLIQRPTRTPFVSVEDDSNLWVEAFSKARLYNQFHTAFALLPRSNVTHREQEVVAAFDRLRAHGVELTARDGRIGTPEEYRRVMEAIVVPALDRSPSTFLRVYLRLLSETFDPEADHYMLGRVYTDRQHAPKTAAIPFGWMYQLLLRTPAAWVAKVAGDELPDELVAALDTLRDLATTFDVEPYHMAQLSFSDHCSLSRDLSDHVLFDTTFMLRQLQPKQALTLLEGMFAWTREEDIAFDLDAMLAVFRAIFNIANNSNDPMAFSAKDISAMTGKSAVEVEQLLAVLAHRSSDVNRTFVMPIFDKAENLPNGMFKPLLSIDKRYILPSRLCAGAPGYEACYTMLRDIYGRTGRQYLDNQLGIAFENLVQRLLKLAGLDVFSGDYSTPGRKGQCDAVVTTETLIIFFECKKKSLTRRALSGSPEQILLDIAGGIVAPHAQAAAAESIIVTAGSLTLTDATGASSFIPLSDRRVVRVAITLLDYGVLTDATVQANIVRLSHGSTLNVSADAPKQHKKTGKEYNESASLLQSSYDQTLAVRPEHEVSWRVNTATWSLPFLMTMLDGVASSVDFEKRLLLSLHMTSSCGDRVQESTNFQRAIALGSNPQG